MKLSLDAFKEMAGNVQEQDVMNNIAGGTAGLFDCHGFWGEVGKAIKDVIVKEIREIDIK